MIISAQKSIWTKLTEVEEQQAMLADWESFPKQLLDATTMRVKYIPCDQNIFFCSMFVVVDACGEPIKLLMDKNKKYDGRLLSVADTVVYRLNHNMLFNLISDTICCSLQTESIDNYQKLWKLGYMTSTGNCRASVFIYLGPDPDGVKNAMSELILQNYQPFLLIVPLNEYITHLARGAAERVGSKVIGLDDILESIENKITAVEYGINLIDKWINAMPQSIKPSVEYRFPTPVGTAWEQVIIEFTAREVINVRCGNVQKRLEPEHLGMKSQKTGRPTTQWVLMQALAMSGGRLSWKDDNAANSIIKQKHELVHKLQNTFQIFDCPIIWDKRHHCYQCKFIIRAAENVLQPNWN